MQSNQILQTTVFTALIGVFLFFFTNQSVAQNFDTRLSPFLGTNARSDILETTPSVEIETKSFGIHSMQSGVSKKEAAKKFAVRLSAGLGHVYTTNAFDTDDPESDNLITPAGSLRFEYKVLDKVTTFVEGGFLLFRYIENDQSNFDTASGGVGVITAIAGQEIQLAYRPTLVLKDFFDDRQVTFHDLQVQARTQPIGFGPHACVGKDDEAVPCTNLGFVGRVVRRIADPSDTLNRTGILLDGELSHSFQKERVAVSIKPSAAAQFYDSFPGESRRDVLLTLKLVAAWQPWECKNGVGSANLITVCPTLSAEVGGRRQFSTVESNDFSAFDIGPSLSAKFEW